jgi:hypothetical protein
MIMPVDTHLAERSVLGLHLRRALEKSFFNPEVTDNMRLYTSGLTFSIAGDYVRHLEWRGMGFDEEKTYRVTMPLNNDDFNRTYPGLASSPLLRVLPKTFRQVTASWLAHEKEF